MERLRHLSSLVVSQHVDWAEVLTADLVETRNKYAILDKDGRKLFLAVERPEDTFLVMTQEGETIMKAVRPFRWYYHRIDVLDSQDRQLGAVQKQFAPLRCAYSVLDASGKEAYQLFGPLLTRPWTIKIRDYSREYGEITKKWGGLLKETQTNADDFEIKFPLQWDPKLKAVFLGAVFLIDCVYFERKTSRG